MKVYVYELPSKYNKKILQKDPRCLTHMFAAEIFMHQFLLASPVRTMNPDEADWFYTPVYSTCDLAPNGLPLPFKSPRMMRSAVQLISTKWPYWNRTEGADHFFLVPHDFGACFHYQVTSSYHAFSSTLSVQRWLLTLLSHKFYIVSEHVTIGIICENFDGIAISECFLDPFLLWTLHGIDIPMVCPIVGRESYKKRHPSVASTLYLGSNFWTTTPCLFEPGFNNNTSICTSRENYVPLDSSRHTKIHLCLLPWFVL